MSPAAVQTLSQAPTTVEQTEIRSIDDMGQPRVLYTPRQTSTTLLEQAVDTGSERVLYTPRQGSSAIVRTQSPMRTQSPVRTQSPSVLTGSPEARMTSYGTTKL